MAVWLLPCLLCAQPQGPDTLWTRVFRDYPGLPISCYGLSLTPDGGAYLTGRTSPFSYGSDLFAMRVDSLGDTLWFRHIGPSIGLQHGGSHAPALDGGLLLAGSQNYENGLGAQGLALHLDPQGDIRWQREYGEPGEQDNFYAVCPSWDDGYVLGGRGRCVSPQWEWWWMGMNYLGDTLWNHYRAELPEIQYVAALCQTPDSGYAMAGYEEVPNVRGYATLVKTDRQGQPQFARCYDYDSTADVYVVDLAALADGYLLACYQFIDLAPSTSMLLIRTDLAGDTLWTRTFTSDQGMGALTCLATPDGNLTVAGWANHASPWTQALLLFRLSAAGELLWWREWSRPQQIENTTRLAVDSQGRYWIATGNDENEMWLLVTEPDPTLVPVMPRPEPLPEGFALHAPYPNPFNSTTTVRFSLPRAAYVSLKVYDVLGREAAVLVDEVREAGEHRVMWEAAEAGSGLYFVRLAAGERSAVRKVMLLK